MKGTMIDVFATLIFIGAVIGTVAFLNASFIKFTGGVETPVENLNALQAAYAVEQCFMAFGEEGYVTREFLDGKKGEFVGDDDFCNISYPPIHAEVADVETGEEWKFDRPLFSDLERIFDKSRAWLWDKITFWKSKGEESHPEHTIFMPIMYDHFGNFAGGDVVVSKGKKYVLIYHKIHDPGVRADDLSLEIYPVERYDGDISMARVICIETEPELTAVRDEMDSASAGSQRSLLITNTYRDITADDLRGRFDLTADHEDCGDSLGRKLCLTHRGRQIHVGRLYVKI